MGLAEIIDQTKIFTADIIVVIAFLVAVLFVKHKDTKLTLFIGSIIYLIITLLWHFSDLLPDFYSYFS